MKYNIFRHFYHKMVIFSPQKLHLGTKYAFKVSSGQKKHFLINLKYTLHDVNPQKDILGT